MEQLKKQVGQLRQQLAADAKQLKLTELQAEQAALAEQMAAADFWQDTDRAQQVSKQEAALRQRIEPWLELQTAADELAELAALGDAKLEAELSQQLAQLERRYETLKKQLRYNGPYDDHHVIMNIYAGAGGTDAQDWAAMLLRMYIRWAEQSDLKTELLDESAGDEAGIKSATLRITGPLAYGRLKGEHGVHRLVRQSPFNSAASRETSFAKVDILPEIDRPDEVELDEKDLKIDVYRSGGHGGQSVNTTDSAVRVTHLPTGITVSIQNERSQLQNKETALMIVRSRLAQLQLEQHAEKVSELKGPNEQAAWGNQIRSYVLHPYKQVKDLRTRYETSDVDGVLNGQLDDLLEAYAELHLGENAAQTS